MTTGTSDTFNETLVYLYSTLSENEARKLFEMEVTTVHCFKTISDFRITTTSIMPAEIRTRTFLDPLSNNDF
jgi:hypothetical protein